MNAMHNSGVQIILDYGVWNTNNYTQTLRHCLNYSARHKCWPKLEETTIKSQIITTHNKTVCTKNLSLTNHLSAKLVFHMSVSHCYRFATETFF